MKFDDEKLRWGVKLADGQLIALKMDNLVPDPSEATPKVDVGPARQRPTLTAASAQRVQDAVRRAGRRCR